MADLDAILTNALDIIDDTNSNTDKHSDESTFNELNTLFKSDTGLNSMVSHPMHLLSPSCIKYDNDNCVQPVDDKLLMKMNITEEDLQQLSSSQFPTKNHDFDFLDNCTSFQRIFIALKQYKLWMDKLEMSTDEHPKIQNVDEFDNVTLLNDFNHLMKIHSCQFEEIYNILIYTIYNNAPCDLSTCLSVQRNYRDRNNESDTTYKRLYFTDNIDETIIHQIFDRIHCYYLHTFDTGYKLSKSEKEDIITE
eukprot:345751_1